MNRLQKIQSAVIMVFFATTGLFAQGMGPGDGMGPGGRGGDCPRFKDGRGMGPGSGRHMRHRPRRGMFFGDVQRLKGRLSLSNAQVNKIEKINLRFRKAHLNLKEKMAPKKIRMRRLLLEEKVDLKKIKVLLKEIAAVEVELRYMKIRHRIEIERVLTPDQKRKLRSERKRKWHRRYKRD